MPAVRACPTPDGLRQFLFGRLAAEERGKTEHHVLHCSSCAAAVVQLLQAGEPRAAQHLLSRDPGSPTGEVAGAPVPLAPPQAPDEMGRLGGYRVLHIIGSGGMGVVFHAEDPVLKRPVALKVMSRQASADPRSRERFLREAKATAAVEHDNVITIHHVGEDCGVPFLAMPLLRGESLDDRLCRNAVLPVAETLRIGREIAAGLHAAHRRGLIHRDIKPANVWLEAATGRVKLLDFGLAQRNRETARLTQSGLIVGTPSYMAPEQARGQEVTARADLYSLGCVLYRCVTGRAPFQGDDIMAVLTAVALETPPRPRELNPELPPAFSDAIMRLLAKDPENRPSSAASVVETLESLEKGQPPADAGALSRVVTRLSTPALPPVVAPAPAAPPEPPPKELGSRWRRQLAVLAASGAVLALMTGAALRMFQDVSADDPPSSAASGRRDAQTPPGCDLVALEARACEAGADLSELAVAARDCWREHAATPDGTRAARLLSRLPSPLDQLDPRHLTGTWPDLPGLVAVLRGHDGPVWAAAFAVDGRTLASGGGDPDQTVAVWDLGAQAPRRRFRSGPLGNAVSAVAFSPAEPTLAASVWDGTVHLWDVRPDVPRADGVLRQTPACFTCLAFAGAGRALAAGTDRGVVWIWDLSRTPPESQARRADALGIVSGVAFAPQRLTLAAAGADVYLWDLGSQAPAKRMPLAAAPAEARGVSFAPDGRLLAAGDNTGTVQLWDLTGAPKPATALSRHTDQVWSVAFAPDGRVFASGGWDGRVVLWDMATSSRQREWLVPGEHVHRVAFAPDSRHLAICAGNDVYVVRLRLPGDRGGENAR
jgi:serine/threonine protein kinase